MAEAPVIVLDHLTEIQKRAYIIADNKLALNAGWDEEILAAELAELEQEGLDLALVGFTAVNHHTVTLHLLMSMSDRCTMGAEFSPLAVTPIHRPSP
jgi:hypothetical protein